MSLFAKKKLYKVVWSWDNSYYYSYTEIVKAKDPAHAWKKICRHHVYTINLVSLEEINMNKLGGKVE